MRTVLGQTLPPLSLLWSAVTSKQALLTGDDITQGWASKVFFQAQKTHETLSPCLHYSTQQCLSLSEDQDMTLVSSSSQYLLIILEGNQVFPPFPLDRKRALTWLLSGQGSTAKSVCPLRRTTNVSLAWTEHRIRALVLLNHPNLHHNSWVGNT